MPVLPSAEDEALDWESLISQNQGLHGGIVYARNPEASGHGEGDDSD